MEPNDGDLALAGVLFEALAKLKSKPESETKTKSETNPESTPETNGESSTPEPKPETETKTEPKKELNLVNAFKCIHEFISSPDSHRELAVGAITMIVSILQLFDHNEKSKDIEKEMVRLVKILMYEEKELTTVNFQLGVIKTRIEHYVGK
jgi:hypothetical protein